ncbi:hypothetical protein V4U86_05335 [Mycobacterium sp. AMU20-3851]|uniref:hypothetical protein n=1 Tax=Mycobacterium sp. AMU20-3851 TaxID=3122055 RepID=UPI003754759E
MTNEAVAPESPGEQAGAAAATDPSPQPVAQKRTWTMPKPQLDKERVDRFGRTAADALTKTASAVVRVIGGLARYVAAVVTQSWRAFDAIPRALKMMFVACVLMLAGIAGTISLAGTAGLVCAVLVVPIAAITLGALGHRWMAEPGAAATPDTALEAPSSDPSDLSRSVLYVDKKLAVALNALGSDRHQQAVIALFQAKTAVELALGTELEEDAADNAPVQVDAYRLRPRIQPGSASKSTIPESNSLAAS